MRFTASATLGIGSVSIPYSARSPAVVFPTAKTLMLFSFRSSSGASALSRSRKYRTLFGLVKKRRYMMIYQGFASLERA